MYYVARLARGWSQREDKWRGSRTGRHSKVLDGLGASRWRRHCMTSSRIDLDDVLTLVLR